MVVLIMGPTGVGKTTAGRGLAEQMGWQFVDADDFHTEANKLRMSQGIVLTDSDREPWLRSIHDALVRQLAEGRNVVLACSALRRSYREQLLRGLDCKLVYLRGSYSLLSRRLGERRGHFAGEKILADQFAVLEEPGEAIVVDVEGRPEAIVAEVRRRLGFGER
jgi:gluconokinase